jgi:hypothetical protein
VQLRRSWPPSLVDDTFAADVACIAVAEARAGNLAEARGNLDSPVEAPAHAHHSLRHTSKLDAASGSPNK